MINLRYVNAQDVEHIRNLDPLLIKSGVVTAGELTTMVENMPYSKFSTPHRRQFDVDLNDNIDTVNVHMVWKRAKETRPRLMVPGHDSDGELVEWASITNNTYVASCFCKVVAYKWDKQNPLGAKLSLEFQVDEVIIHDLQVPGIIPPPPPAPRSRPVLIRSADAFQNELANDAAAREANQQAAEDGSVPSSQSPSKRFKLALTKEDIEAAKKKK